MHHKAPEIPTGPSDRAVGFALRCLGLNNKCQDKEQMKKKWREALWASHPDRAVDDMQDRERKMQMINAAKDLLEERFGKF